jgi:acetyl-CoA decarbonylase/synthase complex subunit gamma
MALTGIQIFKLLPKTNCGKCGIPTCLAFAMNLAAGKAELAACPFVSEESKAQLAEASAPPIRPVTIGTGETAFKVGGETVMFRHEKRFENPTGIAVLITDVMPESEVTGRIEKFNNNVYIRVGLKLHADAIVVKNESGDPAKFSILVDKVVKATGGSLILMSDKPDVLAAGLKICASRKPLL